MQFVGIEDQSDLKQYDTAAMASKAEPENAIMTQFKEFSSNWTFVLVACG